MLEFIISYSVRNKTVVLLFIAALVGAGAYSMWHLRLDALPDITNNQVQVITTAPGLPPEEVERYLTQPLERAMANLPQRTELRSISRFGLSVITIVFEDGVEPQLARQWVNERITLAQKELPPGVGRPEMGPPSTGLSEVFQYTLEAPKDRPISAMELRTLQDWVVKRDLLQVPGVADISSFGGYLKQYEVAYDPDRLAGLNLTVGELLNALAANNANAGGAIIERGERGYYLRTEGLVQSLADVEAIVVRNAGGVPLTVGQVATVRFGHAIRYGAMTADGKGEVVGGIVLMRKGANARNVIADLEARLAELKLAGGVQVVPFLNRKALIDRTIETVGRNLIEGGLIVILVLTLLLGNLRAGLLVASVIPLSLLFAFSLMHYFGVSANLMSLGAIDFGVVVDGSVIIVERILHQLELRGFYKQRKALTQAESDQLVTDQAQRIRQSAAFGEIIILLVYLPILLMRGIEGKMFVPMAQTVSFALLGALVLSLTYTPAMAALVLRVPPRFHLNVAEKLVQAAWRVYLPALRFTLRRPLWVLGLSVALLGVSFWQFTRLGGVFIPRLEEGDFAVETRILTGSSLTQMIATTTEAERLLKAHFPEVKAVVSKIGTSEIPTDPMFIESADIIIVLKDKREWTSARTLDELAEKMQTTLSQLPGVAWGFQMPIQMRFNELMTGGKTDVVLQLYGEELDTLGHLAEQIAAVARKVEGAEDVVAERVEGLPQVVVQVRRDQLARYGLTVEAVNQAVRTAYAGTAVGVVYEQERRFELVLRMQPHLRTDPDAVGRIWVESSTGQRVRLSEVATVELREGPLQVARSEGRRRTAIGLNVRNRDVQAVVQDLKAEIGTRVRLPFGYSITYGGQFENLEQATARMRYSIPAVMLLILLLLYLTFHHLPQTLFIFLGVPFATVGGIWALALRDLPFSVSAAVGFITVFGVSVLNGMVLIGYLRELAQEGHTHLLRRLLTAVQVRLRPVLMTSLVASLGFLPMALSSGDGAEVQRPLATVVIGGLISSTLLTLLLLPLVYYLWEARRRKRTQPGTAVWAGWIALLLCSLPAMCRAQNAESRPTLAQLISAAEAHSPYLRQAAQQTEVDRQRARATFRLPPTELLGSYGRINEPINDVLVNVQQRWAWPGLYVREAQAAKTLTERSEAQYRVLLRFERGAVALLAYQWALQQRRLALLNRYDSLFRALGQVARARAEAGATSPVEPQSLESRALSWQTQLATAQARNARLEESLAFRTGIRLTPASAQALVPELRRPFASVAVTDVDVSSQLLKPGETEIRRAVLQVGVARNSLAPNFLLGYTWQTIRRVGGNHIGSVGLGIPLPLGGNLRQLKVARAQLDLARLEAETRKAELRLQLSQTLSEMAVLAPLLAEQWPQRSQRSAELVAAAQRGYLQGNLPLIDLLLHVEEAAQAELLLLDQLDRWNEAVLLYETLTNP